LLIQVVIGFKNLERLILVFNVEYYAVSCHGVSPCSATLPKCQMKQMPGRS